MSPPWLLYEGPRWLGSGCQQEGVMSGQIWDVL